MNQQVNIPDCRRQCSPYIVSAGQTLYGIASKQKVPRCGNTDQLTERNNALCTFGDKYLFNSGTRWWNRDLKGGSVSKSDRQAATPWRSARSKRDSIEPALAAKCGCDCCPLIRSEPNRQLEGSTTQCRVWGESRHLGDRTHLKGPARR